MSPIYQEENSFIKNDESISMGNKVLYDFCGKNPMSDSVNALIAKLWIIGRSYAASPERRSYSRDYTNNDGNVKLDLNTGSNGTDSFFRALSEKIIACEEYEELIDTINSLSNDEFNFDCNHDKVLLINSTNAVLLFNRILRESLEECDENALEKYENLTCKKKEDRNLKYFLSFSSKFIHFHLPKLVFIMDSFSFAHAKKRLNRKRNSPYIYVNNQQEISLTINSSDFTFFTNNEFGKVKEQEQNYIDHVVRSYTIMCKIKNEYKCVPTPRMLDNFIMRVNLDSVCDEIDL